MYFNQYARKRFDLSNKIYISGAYFHHNICSTQENKIRSNNSKKDRENLSNLRSKSKQHILV